MNKSVFITFGVALLATTACSSARTAPVSVASSACGQLGDVSALAATHLAPEQLYAAREVRERQFLARALQPERTTGADLYLHATPGVTAEYLERTFACHAARGRSLDDSDPFHPTSGPVAQVEVRSIGNGFAVRVLSPETDTAREIWQRAADRVSPSGDVTVEQIAANAPDTGSM